MSCVAYKKFDINQGATWQLVLLWKNPDLTPVNVTGYSVVIQFRKTVRGAIVLYEMSTTNGKVTLDGPAGKITALAPKEDTSTFTFDSAVFDVLATSPSGVASRLINATIRVIPAVTR